ncbi:MAG: hypothetical protein AAGH40_03980 [Verrucomicrobiota bacterium]
MSEPIVETGKVLESLRSSVAKALERKRRLGQYAVVSRNGKLVRLQPEEIEPQVVAEDQAEYNS